MRLLETLIPILLSAYLLWSHPRPQAIRYLPALAFILTLNHFVVEGYRWQMIPIYILTAILGISALLKLRSATDWKPLASYLTLSLLAASTALPVLLPVPDIPAPSGPYPVGTRIWELMADGAALAQVHAVLCTEFEAEPERIQEDLLGLVRELSAAGLVRID